MKQSGKELIVYTSRRKKLDSVIISPCKVAAEKRPGSLNSLPEKGATLKRKNEKGKIVKRGRKKNKRKLRECDDVTRLQRRARYLLVKIKLEKNLLEAYDADGWNGRSREKVKPEKELERAEKEIIKCKLSIREVIRELDLLITTCQCDCHQRCSESPEKVPGADNKRLCKYHENKIMIIEAINAHLCTSFTIDSFYVDIFKEEATSPVSKLLKFKDEKEWPSDESDDEDYKPELNEGTCITGNETELTDSDELDLSSSGTSNSRSDEINFEEADEGEIMHRPRKRTDVDYKKLHNEMFGCDSKNEEDSEDEEWGPRVRKKHMKEANVDGCMAVDATGDANKVLHNDAPEHMSKYSRIPPSAVKELQQAFAKNELPSRSVKENLSKQLGLSQKKVDIWFRNARYAALKLQKMYPSNSEKKKIKYPSNSEEKKIKCSSKEAQEFDASYFLPLSELIHVPERSGNCLQRHELSKTKGEKDEVPHQKTALQRHLMSATSSHSSSRKQTTL